MEVNSRLTDNNSVSNQIPLQPTSYEIWEKKYQLKDQLGNPVDKTIEDTYKRVAKALASVEVDSDYWYERFLWALQNGATPAGRIMSNVGAEQYKPATSTINCLAGDTPVVTRQGVVKIRELAGKDVEILNGNGQWTVAPFKSFGEQETFKVTLRWGDNKKTKTEIYATKDHRWFLQDGRVVTTEFWMTGGLNKKTRTIPHLFVPKEQFIQSEWDMGFIHGLVYGDGSAVSTPDTYILNLCGEKQEMVGQVQDILEKSASVYEKSDTTRFTVKSSVKLKCVPSTYTYSYLRGFIAGVLATDGSVVKNNRGCEVVLYGDKDLIDFISTNSIYCGVVHTYSRKSAGRGQVTNYGPRSKDLWVIGLHPATVELEDVIRSQHKNNFKKSDNGTKVVNKWIVESVSSEAVVQEVFCCHEYETTAFAIANGMKTGQCTVSGIVRDSMSGILDMVKEAGMTLKAGCGIGYEFSTLRPKGSFVAGAGAYTSGPLSFMDIFDKMCFTVSSAGGRRGAQMGTFAIWHPDVEEFIKAKREDGRLRQFNLSLLIDEMFIKAVESKSEYSLVFPVTQQEIDYGFAPETEWRDLFWEESYCKEAGYILKEGKILCKVYKKVNAEDLWNTIMKSTYDYAEPKQNWAFVA